MNRACVCVGTGHGHSYVFVSVNACEFPLFSFFILRFIFATFQLSIVDWNGCESKEKTDERTSERQQIKKQISEKYGQII